MKRWLCGLFGHPLLVTKSTTRKNLYRTSQHRVEMGCKCGHKNGVFTSNLDYLDVEAWKNDFKRVEAEVLAEVHRDSRLAEIGVWGDAA